MLSEYTGYKKDAPNVYFPIKKRAGNTSNYWLACPNNANSQHLFCVSDSGNLNNQHHGNDYIGFRPVIYLPPTVTLEKDINIENLWHINYGE